MGTAVIGMGLENVPGPQLPTDGNSGKADGKWKKCEHTHSEGCILSSQDESREGRQIW